MLYHNMQTLSKNYLKAMRMNNDEFALFHF